MLANAHRNGDARMKAIGLLAQKGGAGKTTLCIHLACAAGNTLIVDCDRQKSAAHWWQSREEDLPGLVTSPAGSVRKALTATQRQWVFVDTAPQADVDARRVAEVSDFLLIPSRPSVLDLRAIADTIDIVRAVRKPAAIVLNACPPGRGVAPAGIVTEAKRALSVYGLPVAPVAITQRVAFSHAITAGKGITEYEPGGAAASEIERLWKWLHRSVQS